MPCQHPVYAWIELLVTALTPLTRPQATVLALYSFGAILAKRCGLNSVATALEPALDAKFTTIRSRLQEFYQPANLKSGGRRRQLDVSSCFAALLGWVLKGWPVKRLALALDATSLGDCFTVLSISVVYRGSAIPVAWKVFRANVKHPWKAEWLRLLAMVRPWVPGDWTVVVMTDRGLYARWLFQAIVDLRWHPLMRITSAAKFRTQGSGRIRAIRSLVPQPGHRWQGRGLAFPKKPERRLACTLLACWEPGHEQAWFLVTDLAPAEAEGLWYAMRAWIEQGFKLLKSGGWQWQATRMTDPERAERLWLVLAVATCFVLKVGGEADDSDTPVATIVEPRRAAPEAGSVIAGRRPARRTAGPRGGRAPKVPTGPGPAKRESGTRVRLVSVFLRGLSVLVNYLITHHRLPQPHWKVEPWLVPRSEIQRSKDQPRTPIPKNPSL